MEVNEEEESKHDRIGELEARVAENPEDSALRFQLGLLLWEMSGDESSVMKEKAAEQFVVSAKLDPLNAEPFKYLGHYYARFSPDIQRSNKCYQRAVSLNPDDSDAGEPLCDLLDRDGKETLQIAICSDASEKSPRAFWAFRRMGYLYLHQNDYSRAVHCLQHAIRGYPTSPHLWEALGVSYHRLGMFTAATKSYGRAIELDASSILALVESGNIFVMLGSYKKAVEQFRLAQNVAPKNIAVCYGLASALLCWSHESMTLGAFNWGTSLLEEASQVVYEATCMAENLFSLWKLHGDIKLTYAKCFPWMGEDTCSVDGSAFHDSILSWKKSCYFAAESARNFYQRAIHLAPWNANLYADIAVSSDLLLSLGEKFTHNISHWQLSEKMVLGALLLERCNFEFWVILGQISCQNTLKQHSLIRGLQLNLSSAIAWSALGMLYREEGDINLSRKAFDCARSMDPSLALPWAGVSSDAKTMGQASNEAFECCLRAVQILPLAEFQVGLAKLALMSGNLTSPQVFGAIEQAIKRAPHYPETHNLKGLICEARGNYKTAVISYRLAQSAIKCFLEGSSSHYLQDTAVNLTRCLGKGGHPADCLQQCQNLKMEGLFGEGDLQILALSLWQLDKTELALSVVKDLMTIVSTKATLQTSSVTFICRLLYRISGIDSTIDFILKMPKEWIKSWKVAVLVHALSALGGSDRLGSLVSSINTNNLTYDERIEAHYLMAFAELLPCGSSLPLAFKKGIRHLKKGIHAYPGSNILRSFLGNLLLSNDEWHDGQSATRCCAIKDPHHSNTNHIKSEYEIIGAASLACHALGIKAPKLSFHTCGCKCSSPHASVTNLQRWLRQEPWNHDLRYLLILNLVQRAREERFPRAPCSAIHRLLSVSLSNESVKFQHQRFQLLLCAAEVSLQCGNFSESVALAKSAVALPLPANHLFFGHLFLCRAFAAQQHLPRVEEEFLACISLKTDYYVGWVLLLTLQLQHQLFPDSNILSFMLKECSQSINVWLAIWYLIHGLFSHSKKDFPSSEQHFSYAASLAGAEPCYFLCHGVSCLALAKQTRSVECVKHAARSLGMAQTNSAVPLPIVSLLEAQAEGSLGSKEKWGDALGVEWYCWPTERRPAEAYFQMHLLAKEGVDTRGVALGQRADQWLLRAVHTNPSCLRYWRALRRVTCEG